jgi:cardiolipin synthase
MVHGKSFVDEVRLIEDDYRRKSREITLEGWLSRPAGLQVLDNVARLTASVQ